MNKIQKIVNAARNIVSLPRVCIACVSENKEPYITETVYLFRSIIENGGKLRNAIKIAYFVNEVDRQIGKLLNDLGVEVKIINSIDSRFPHLNKLRMLENSSEYDFLIALDCDTVVVRDFSLLLQRSAVMVAPAAIVPFTLEQWKRVFLRAGISFPNERILSRSSLVETIPYFNSGVLCIPQKYISVLYESWLGYARTVADIFDAMPDIAKHFYYNDQIALSLAIESKKIPVSILPIGMNFHTNTVINPALRPNSVRPYIIHNHHRLIPEGLMQCSYDNINKEILKINKILQPGVYAKEF